MNNYNLNISVVSNITLEPFFKKEMNDKFFNENYKIKIDYIMLEEIMEREKSLEDSDICLVWINYEQLVLKQRCDNDKTKEEILLQMNLLKNKIQETSKAQIIWIGFEDYYDKLNLCLGSIIDMNYSIDELNGKLKRNFNDSTVLIDLKEIMALTGIKKSYDMQLKHRWNSPYSQNLMTNVVAEIFKQYLILKGITKKCIVLDCDNVLWGGILSEDGIENIKLGGSNSGSAFSEFQLFLKQLSKLGVILTVCSKNNFEDVKNVFNSHDEMILREEDIAYFRVNWENKAKNIKEISEFLNIGLDSMVFIDDSIFEIESIKYMIPEITTILFEKENIFDNFNCFNLNKNINGKSIENRLNTYKTNGKREKLRSKHNSYEEYLNALETKISIKEASLSDYGRISELSQRTNKCTIGKRYKESQLKEININGNYHLYSVNVSDKFSDLGKVGAFGVKIQDHTAIIDLFCLSCRSIGRNVENEMLEFICNKYKVDGCDFIQSNKNQLLQKVLEKKMIL